MLNPELSDQLRVALRVYSKAKDLQVADFTYCFVPLAHQLRQRLKWQGYTPLESAAIDDSLENGDYFNLEEQLSREAEEQFGPNWAVFRCAICEVGTMFAQLDEGWLQRRSVRVTRVRCVQCAFQTPDHCPFLADALLEPYVNGRDEEILRHVGERA